jgi:SAM-dependent methyltransferase
MKKISRKEYKKHIHYKLDRKYGVEKLGLMSGKRWREDPKGTLFTLSRYKFVSKLLQGKDQVLEIGCGDGWYSRVVKQTVKNLTLSDTDAIFLENSQKREKIWKFNYLIHNMIDSPTVKKFDAIYLLDVFEHINKKNENIFLANISKSLKKDGILITGTPSYEFQKYVKNPDPTHINCKTGKQLRSVLKKYFENVFIFSMNDEIVHTGFEKMANYFFSLCLNKKI